MKRNLNKIIFEWNRIRNTDHNHLCEWNSQLFEAINR